jgi:hypothetical protein
MVRTLEDAVTTALRLAIAAATLATVSVGIAAVWLTSDPRAFGVVVILAGVAFGVVAWRNEWRARKRDPYGDTRKSHGVGTTHITKAG